MIMVMWELFKTLMTLYQFACLRSLTLSFTAFAASGLGISLCKSMYYINVMTCRAVYVKVGTSD